MHDLVGLPSAVEPQALNKAAKEDFNDTARNFSLMGVCWGQGHVHPCRSLKACQDPLAQRNRRSAAELTRIESHLLNTVREGRMPFDQL